MRITSIAHVLVFWTMLACVAEGGFKYKIPTVIGDPAHQKFSIVEYQQISDAFQHPSRSMQSWILTYYQGIDNYDDFIALPLHSQIWVVNRTVKTVAPQNKDKPGFLMNHFPRLSHQLAAKVVDYK